MTARMLTYCVAGVLAVIAGCAGVLTAVFGGAPSAYACAPTQPSTSASDATTPPVTVGRWDAQQTGYAATIISVGMRKQVPARGWVIAVATALQESNLRNLGDLGAHNDHDSLGLFQQRPSQGWGTPEQLMDPVYAAGKFYDKLMKVTNWQRLPLTVAAQAVQISAYPNAYAKWEPDAQQLVSALAATAALGSECQAPISALGWTQPVHADIVSGWRTADRPTHNGVDLGAARFTPIHAAASGVVIVARCDADTGDCDHDGSPSTPGCGWFVDIQHDGNVITRYCHMVRQPAVHVGDHVLAGQPIGLLGTSGNSSGPHLHFEVHLNADRSWQGGIDPQVFMAAHGAPLGH